MGFKDDMARPGHRPLTTYRAFGVFVALWAAALCGLVVFVLPDAILARAISAIGLAPVLEDGGVTNDTMKIAASALAAFIGGVVGLLAVGLAARRHRYDPRPLYADADLPPSEPEEQTPEPARRPLRIREELVEDMPDIDEPRWEPAFSARDSETSGESDVVEADGAQADTEDESPVDPTPLAVSSGDAPEPRADIPTLLEQFDRALACFREGHTAAPQREPEVAEDPLHAFLARQAGAAPRTAPQATKPFDHQAELRLALDKLVRARSKD